MKQTLTFIAIALLCFCNRTQAQTYPLFNTSVDIDVANIKAPHMVHGDMWRILSTSASGVEFPKGSGNYVGSTSALWMSAYDAQNNLKAAAQTYRNRGNDYWPGPADSPATTPAIAYATSQNWAKIWKINSSDIDAFLLAATHTAANTPAAILEWPARGNPYAKGAGGVSLTITTDLAPFVDVNADGVYNPLAGDYPKMKGSQMLWWIINDASIPHTLAQTGNMKMEIKMSAYAYQLGTVADNIIFYEYEITNKSTVGYTAYRMGVMVDFDIENANLNYAGFDSGRRMGITYNGVNTTSSGSGVSPAAGLAIMELPGDAYHSYSPAGSFVPFHNDVTALGDPINAGEFNYVLHSRNRAGQAYINGSSYGYMNEHEDCDANSLPGDIRFTIASGDVVFSPGQTRKFGTALVLADSTGGCPFMDFTRLHNTADTAYKIYWNPMRVTPNVTPTGVTAILHSALRIFPNPVAGGVLHVETAHSGQGLLNVYDALGKSIVLPVSRMAKGFDISTATLPAGVYSIRLQDNAAAETGIFVKE